MSRLPDFMIIGAMKCATSTLHEQLAAQPGIIMSEPKEPYFFSDDPVYAKGMDWYTSLFSEAGPEALCGESTTHYTKLPTYPKTIERIQQHVPNAKFIYIMRHPIERLVSQYIHQWTEREITVPIDEAVDQHRELKAYSEYSYQLEAWFEAFGRNNILPLFFDRIRQHPQAELERVCQFIGYKSHPAWQTGVNQQNKSSERMRVSPIRDMIVNAPILSTIRKRLVPQSVRDHIKNQWQMDERPELSEVQLNRLEAHFDKDLAKLGRWLNIELTCKNFKSVTRDQILGWSQ